MGLSWDFSTPISAWKPCQRRAIRSKSSIVSCRGRAFAPRSRQWCSRRTSSRRAAPAEAVRCHPDVQDAGPASAQQSVGRAGGISGARPAVVLALRLAIEDSIPDATTLWLFREKLAKAGLIEKLFDRFDQHLAAKGYMARGGQIIDASIVPVPTQRNSREENAELQAGRTPAGWKQKPGKLRQKDRDARWTKKHGRSFFGYKNHVNADTKHKLIRHYAVTDAAVHDSQELDGLLDMGNTCNDVFADSAYRSTEIEAHLRASGYKSRIHRRCRRNHPLSSAQQRANHAKSRIRARIEHVFGAQQSAPGGRIVRTIGVVRARAKIGLQNLAYNIRRLVTLERLAAA